MPPSWLTSEIPGAVAPSMTVYEPACRSKKIGLVLVSAPNFMGAGMVIVHPADGHALMAAEIAAVSSVTPSTRAPYVRGSSTIPGSMPLGGSMPHCAHATRLTVMAPVQPLTADRLARTQPVGNCMGMNALEPAATVVCVIVVSAPLVGPATCNVLSIAN